MDGATGADGPAGSATADAAAPGGAVGTGASVEPPDATWVGGAGAASGSEANAGSVGEAVSAADRAEPAAAPRQTWCPSAGPERPESVVLGVQSPQHGQVSYLAEPIPAAEAVAMLPEGIDPRRVLRFAAHCNRQCPNNAAGDCTLVDRMQAIPVAAEQGHAIPRCHLRQDCQWWHQVGVEACRRCPALVTTRAAGHAFHELVADPGTTRADLEAWIAANPTASLAVGN